MKAPEIHFVSQKDTEMNVLLLSAFSLPTVHSFCASSFRLLYAMQFSSKDYLKAGEVYLTYNTLVFIRAE